MEKKRTDYLGLLFAFLLFALIGLFFQFNVLTNNKIFVNADSKISIEITDVSVNNKSYDGTTLIEIANIENTSFNVDDDVEIIANTLDENVGENKEVVFSLIGSDKDKYQIIQPVNKTYATISPCEVELVWTTKLVKNGIITSTKVNSNAYKYNREDQLKGVSAYYINIKTGNPQYLSLSVSGRYEYDFNLITPANSLLNAGTYTVQALMLSGRDSNYIATNETKTITIQRVKPEICVKDVNFVYNGLSQTVNDAFYIDNEGDVNQVLEFKEGTNSFTTYQEAKNLQVQVRVKNDGINYLGFDNYITFPINTISIEKATPTFDLSEVQTNFVYNGNIQIVSGAKTYIEVNNQKLYTDQTINYNDELFFSFENVIEANNKIINIKAIETSNCKQVETSIKINVSKKQIGKNWDWKKVSVFSYDKSLHTVEIEFDDLKYKNMVNAIYEKNENVNAGVYVAKVALSLKENYKNNYELVVNIPNLIWTINKATVSTPNLQDIESSYNGFKQYSSLQSTEYYNVLNNTQTNSGNYILTLELKDKINYNWSNGNSNDLYVNWTIKKAKVEIPNCQLILKYTGDKTKPSIEQNNIYKIYSDEQSDVGNYKCFLALLDVANYEWASDGSSKIITLNWKIVLNDNYNSTSQIILILVLVILLILIAISLTLHFTIKSKRRKKRKNQQKLNTESQVVNQVNINIPSTVERINISEDVVSDNVVKVELTDTNKLNNESIDENSKPIKIVKNQKNIEIKINNNEPVEKNNLNLDEINNQNLRKKRMLSMKKNDKRKRRQVENKKKALTNKPPVKRGRPPKKKTKTSSKTKK